jgi:hypothetical protein
MGEFNPNKLTFEDGVKRVHAALKKANLDMDKAIVTSRDRAAIEATKLLTVNNVPKGFIKWQLPIVLQPSQLFISVGSPNVEVKEHSHDDGAGVRFIISGTIQHNGQELVAGDWMYIPKGAKYSFKVGPHGATMGYCYCCCCAGSLAIGEDVINPNPFAR